jgi:putative ABC transport system ATP-binding protein
MALNMPTGIGASVAAPTPGVSEDHAEAMVEAVSLYRFFRVDDDETLALQGVSLRVARGEVLAVAGPSGSGKSTLLACLAGLDEPSGGTVHVNGLRVSHQPEPVRARLRAQHIGVLSQSGNFFPHLTVTGNIRLAQSLAGGRSRRPDNRALLAGLGIAHRAHALPTQLSGGESARAGLAVALANDPALLIADEPTGELDSATESRLLDLLVERARNGCAVVLASHSPAVIRRADRVVHLLDGRIAS